MSLPAKLILLLACFIAGLMAGIKWQHGVQARADLAAADIRATDTRQQRQLGDKSAITHAAALVAINQKLGGARAHIAKLSGRECFGAGTVSLLNAIGDSAVRATALDPAREAAPIAPGGGLRFATQQDAATAIATCRSAHAELSSQVNQILDIEDQRHPSHASSVP